MCDLICDCAPPRSHLAPSRHAQILGKLGGKSRLFLIQPAGLEVRPSIEEGLTLAIPVQNLGDETTAEPNFEECAPLQSPLRDGARIPMPMDSFLDIIRSILTRENTLVFNSLTSNGNPSAASSSSPKSSKLLASDSSTGPSSNVSSASALTKHNLFLFLRSTILAMFDWSASGAVLCQLAPNPSASSDAYTGAHASGSNIGLTSSKSLEDFLNSPSLSAPLDALNSTTVFESTQELLLLRSRLLRFVCSSSSVRIIFMLKNFLVPSLVSTFLSSQCLLYQKRRRKYISLLDGGIVCISCTAVGRCCICSAIAVR